MRYLGYREGKELSCCPSWSNSLWQGWSCGQVHSPGGNASGPIRIVLASSDGISCWTPLKPQHCNPNPDQSNLTMINKEIISFNQLFRKLVKNKKKKPWTSLIEHHPTIPALHGLPKPVLSKKKGSSSMIFFMPKLSQSFFVYHIQS